MSAHKDSNAQVVIHDVVTEIGDGMDITWITERGVAHVNAPTFKLVAATITPHPRGKNPHARRGH